LGTNVPENDMKYVIDTNIFLRVLINEHELSYRSGLELLEEVKLGKWDAVVPGVVLSELAWILSSYYKFPKTKVVMAIQSVMNLRGLTVVDEYEYHLAFDLYLHHSVKYIDACIASMPMIQNQQAIIVSYDHDFDKLGVQRKEPHQVKS
jgi:predicted nucleic acid-binding protein